MALPDFLFLSSGERLGFCCNSTGNTDDNNTTLTSGNVEAQESLESDIPTAVPLEGETNQAGANPAAILPIIGLVLIAAAVFIVLFLRRGSSEASTDTGAQEE